MDNDVARARAELPAVTEEGRTHLNNCSAAPIPQRGLDARRECERVWITEANPWETWLAKVNDAKSRFARLVGADDDEIAVLSSATQAFAQVASALDYDERPEVVTTDLEFPTVVQFWDAQQRRGARLRVAESPDGKRVPADVYADEMGEDTLLVCSSHAYSFTGGLMDVGAVADAVHEAGGYLFLDAYQSAGVVPIDVDEMGVDMLVSGTLKFLCGGPGIAFLYVDGDIAGELVPSNVGWFGVDDVFGFETRDPTLAPGARRFELGTPPAPNAYQAEAGMSFVMDFGIDRVRRRVREHTRRLVAGVEDAGFRTLTPRDGEYRGGVVNVQVRDPAAAAEALTDRGFNLGTRAGGVRLSPHFYNTAGEIDAAVDALAETATPTDA